MPYRDDERARFDVIAALEQENIELEKQLAAARRAARGPRVLSVAHYGVLWTIFTLGALLMWCAAAAAVARGYIPARFVGLARDPVPATAETDDSSRAPAALEAIQDLLDTCTVTYDANHTVIDCPAGTALPALLLGPMGRPDDFE